MAKLSLVISGLILTLQLFSQEKLAPGIGDFSYGPHERNVMDVFQAESDQPAPAVLMIHGGGFTGGDKSRMNNEFLRNVCNSGITVVTINYRLIPENKMKDAFDDGVRALQFIRSMSDEWNIDPDRIAAYGGSAGANMAIWIAVQDDMADPGNPDPVKRESTRLACVLGNGAQTFNNPLMILEHIGGNPMVHPTLLKGMTEEMAERAESEGIASVLEGTDQLAMLDELSAIHFVTPDDPPLYLRYNQENSDTPLPPDTSIGISIHHPKFGYLMKEKYEAVGLECHVVCKGDTPEVDPLTWLKDLLFGD